MNLLVFKSHCPILSTKSPVDRVPVREFYWATELVTRYYGTSLSSISELFLNEGYYNTKTQFRSYFLVFGDGARLEIMNKPVYGMNYLDEYPASKLCAVLWKCLFFA